ncbi:lipase family alpha/beta hydrolase [Actinomadura rugatobispora]|uniref:Lipase family alpha/beta hydrolase n=1 Tax=Actinomadura rugatobispora TaxID=1994 RepID=A0ABW1A6Z5_9ACTN|nr:hypothetical protein GCM10010200_022060 [Actinomadura rugatobispora]
MDGIAGGDVVVVIPGILGSVLRRGNRTAWGYRQIFTNVHRLADRISADLAPGGDLFEQIETADDDGIEPVGVMRTLGIIPGFFAIQGYDALVAGLRRWFAADPGAVHEFPYDWRRSNEYTARRLRSFVESTLRERRSRAPGAKAVLVAHSMGGLVARYYAECLDDERLVRRVVTIGTPYQGSVKALGLLANGFVRVGPAKLRLGELARSFPSVAELLPTYPCVGPSADELRRFGALPGIPDSALRRSRDFHQRINDAISENGAGRPRYHAVLSGRNRTDLWAYPDDGGELSLRRSEGFHNGGDGTVPRCSAAPPEWPDDSGAIFVAGRHSGLQQEDGTLRQIRGILSAHPRIPQAAGDELAMDAEMFVEPGALWELRCRSVEGAENLVLAVRITGPAGPDSGTTVTPLVSRGGGAYSARVPIERPGVYYWNVHAELTGASPVEPVSDVLLCAAADTAIL